MRRVLLVLALLGAALTLAHPAAAQAPPSTPVPEAALTGVRSVATGTSHSCALLMNGQVRCWGDGSYGKLGNDDPVNAGSSTPVTVLNTSGGGPLTDVAQVSLGYNHSCALLTNRQVRCWGFNDSGQLATNTGYMSYRRAVVALDETGTAPLRNVIAIEAGHDMTCALLAGGQVRCWGANSYGGLGDGTVFDRPLPRPVLSPAGPGRLSGVTQISVSGHTSCARLANGQARCWGYNDRGQVGDSGVVSRRRPRIVLNPAGSGPLTGVRQISAGDGQSCAVLNSGQARCWGANTNGGLGNGTTADRGRPAVVRNAAGTGPLTGITAVDAGGGSACARTGSGRLWCWGAGDHGQMGNGDLDPDNLLPIAVENPGGSGPLTGVTRFAMTSRHGCARLANQAVRCWGYGLSGNLGNGNSVDSAVTVVVST